MATSLRSARSCTVWLPVTDQRAARVAKVVAELVTLQLDALVVSGQANIRYLTGFSGSNALLLVTARQLVLITDFRYETQVRDEVGDLAAVRIEMVSLWVGLWHVLKHGPALEVIGFESAQLSHRDFQRLLTEGEGDRWTWRPHSGVVETLRESKDDGELELITLAAGIATKALATSLAQVSVGMTELAVAGVLEKALRDEGSEAHPFAAIVASGPRSALPHARASGRRIELGDFLLLDFGAELGGYCSDVTRTVVMGRATDEQRGVYEIVRSANARATAAVRAGMTGKDADGLARSYIDAQGFGEEFGHSLGHGIGLEVHEAPRLARTVEARLADRAVVTVEPGIYRAGWGGVRIEDDLFLGPTGPRVLTDFPRDLLELG